MTGSCHLTLADHRAAETPRGSFAKFPKPFLEYPLAGGGGFPPKSSACETLPGEPPARASPPLLPQPRCFPHLPPEVVTPFLLPGSSPDGGRAGGLGGRQITGGASQMRGLEMCLTQQLSSPPGFSPPLCRQMSFAELCQRRVADGCSPAREKPPPKLILKGRAQGWEERDRLWRRSPMRMQGLRQAAPLTAREMQTGGWQHVSPARCDAAWCGAGANGRPCVAARGHRPTPTSLRLLLEQLTRGIAGTRSSLTLPHCSRQKTEMRFGLAAALLRCQCCNRTPNISVSATPWPFTTQNPALGKEQPFPCEVLIIPVQSVPGFCRLRQPSWQRAGEPVQILQQRHGATSNSAANDSPAAKQFRENWPLVPATNCPAGPHHFLHVHLPFAIIHCFHFYD